MYNLTYYKSGYILLPMISKPASVFDRDVEWKSLSDFAERRGPGATLGLVYGRRRQGKTLLLESLCAATGGFYHMALEQEDSLALRDLGESIGRFIDSPGPVALGDWNDAINALLYLGRRLSIPVVLDEFPYLVAAANQLPSVIQRAFAPGATGRTSSRTHLILCGSALSVMARLLSGRAALRGRAMLDLIVQPFDFREAGRFWDLADQHELATRLHAVVGGTPAYKELSGIAPPQTLGDFDEWISATVLNPASALFREGRYLMAEEPGLEDRALYHSVLTAIAEGNTRPGQVAGILGRPQTAITHPLKVLEDIRLIRRDEDALRRRRPTYQITEPILRFYHAVMRRHLTRLELGSASDMWREARSTFPSLVLGPHFEELARYWTLRYASNETLGGTAVTVGRTVVQDRSQGRELEVDVVAAGRSSGSSRVRAVGEAKWQATRLDEGELERLIRIRSLLADQGVANAKSTRLLLFCPGGFTRGLQQRGRRGEVELVDLARLYSGE